MKNDIVNIYSNKDCKLKYIPELPVFPEERHFGENTEEGCLFDSRGYNAAIKEYEQELQQAKDNAIVIANEEEVKAFILKELFGHNNVAVPNWGIDTIYPLEGYEAEIKESNSCTHCNREFEVWVEPKKVAYIKPVLRNGITTATRDISVLEITDKKFELGYKEGWNDAIKYVKTMHELDKEEVEQAWMWKEIVILARNCKYAELKERFIVTRK